ncbi:MAG: NepR family anti-sigma factor [Pseudomonadota bacterium]
MASEKPKSSVEQQIDENLKRVYNAAMEDKVPDKFLDLLSQLKAKETANKKDRTDGSDS